MNPWAQTEHPANCDCSSCKAWFSKAKGRFTGRCYRCHRPIDLHKITADGHIIGECPAPGQVAA